MIRLENTKNCSFLRGNNTVQGLILGFLLIWNCSGGTYQNMATTDPARLVALEDSLSQTGLSTAMIKSLKLAHMTLGERAMVTDKHKKAEAHFSKALELSPNDTIAKYNQLMVQGHILYSSGKKDRLWEAIQTYHKAAAILEKLGEPHYHIGRAYHKIGDKEFDLIIESYDRALNLRLSPELRGFVNEARLEAVSRDNRLKNFWK